MDSMSTRGIRNNNPANIRRGCIWRGLSKTQSDKEFCQFISMAWGVRALLVTLRTYVKKYHLHTVREIITRWAPPSDGNNTEAYIKFVQAEINELNAPVLLTLQEYDFHQESQHSKCVLFIIARAMCKMESGYDLTYAIYLYALNLM